MVRTLLRWIEPVFDGLRTGLSVLPTALVGAVGFLTRLPVGTTAQHWDAFRRQPIVVLPVAVVLGAVVSLPLLAGRPATTTALLFPIWLVFLTGITHLDGLADLGDAAVVHGQPADRRSVMRDTTTGVGALVAVGLGLAGLVLAALSLATMPVWTTLGIVVAAEVGAKIGLLAIAALGTATHDGLGAELTGETGPRTLAVGGLCILPVAGLTWPGVEAAAALAGAALATLAVLVWARRNLGGVSGDVFGATNELARLAALHAGVIAWTL